MCALIASFYSGHWLTKTGDRAAVLSGPYSDDYGPALRLVSQAKAKIATGDSSISQELDGIENHIERAQNWAYRFTSGTDDPFPRSEP